jgi:hypothetical protein
MATSKLDGKNNGLEDNKEARRMVRYYTFGVLNMLNLNLEINFAP